MSTPLPPLVEPAAELTRDEVARVVRELDGIHSLIGRLLYGSGMRIME